MACAGAPSAWAVCNAADAGAFTTCVGGIGTDPAITLTGSFGLGSPVTLSVGSGTVTIDGAPNGISGANGITKEGAGTLALTANNTNSGTTTLSAGTLVVGNGGTSGSLGTGAIVNNSDLIFFRSDNVSAANVSGTGVVTQLGAGVLTLSGSNTYTGFTTINNGTVRAGGAGVFSAGSTVQMDTGATLDLNNFNQTVGGLSGSGSVTLGNAAGGTLTVAGNGVFSGAISGNGGLT